MARSFSWKQGLVHAMIPLAVVLVVGGLVSVLGLVASPYRFGKQVGNLVVLPMLAAFGLSCLAQLGRRRLAGGLGLALLLALVLAVVALARAGR